MQARNKEKKRKEKKKNLHRTLERAEDYSEIAHMEQVGRLELSSGVTSAQSTDSVLNH